MGTIDHTCRLATAMLTVFLTAGCVEEFQPKTEIEKETEQLSSALVVDALLTDELMKHRVILSRAFSFEETGPQPESNAEVIVIENESTPYTFNETEPGIYESQVEFAAEQGSNYTLTITTDQGNEYVSETVLAPPAIPIADLRADRIVNDKGRQGVGIFLDNTSEDGKPTFFRYEFEETYKIIAPRWDPFRFVVVRYEPCFPDPFVVEIELWEDERQVCFESGKSSRLIQTSSVGLDKSEIENFQIHFLDAKDYIISHRYSILVTQYSQTQEAFSFYERLGDFSSSENLFSQVQPGFLEGNILTETDSSEGVLGYFEVASVSKRRMYFNYEDLFPGEPLPPYVINCETFGNPRLFPRGYHCAGPGVCDGKCDSPLIDQILGGLVSFAGEKENDFLSPYYTWPSPCGDCTKLGSNVRPEFWEEE